MTASNDRRQGQRRAADSGAAPPAPGLPALLATKPEPPPTGVYSAQLLGQGGEKRGLKGGTPVLDAAKSAYLEVEFSGPDDRRPPTGRVARKAV